MSCDILRACETRGGDHRYGWPDVRHFDALCDILRACETRGGDHLDGRPDVRHFDALCDTIERVFLKFGEKTSGNSDFTAEDTLAAAVFECVRHLGRNPCFANDIFDGDACRSGTRMLAGILTRKPYDHFDATFPSFSFCFFEYPCHFLTLLFCFSRYHSVFSGLFPPPHGIIPPSCTVFYPLRHHSAFARRFLLLTASFCLRASLSAPYGVIPFLPCFFFCSSRIFWHGR